MSTSPLKSMAQHAMITRAATDADYAKSRGITCEAARSMLDAHEAAGAPKLPDRVETKAPQAKAPRAKGVKPWWER